MHGISANLIVRNCGPAAVQALRSLKPLLAPGDEVVVVDTGSTDDTVARIRRDSRLGTRLRVLERPDLCDPDMPRRMLELLGDRAAPFVAHPQFEGGCIRDFALAREAARQASRNPILFWLDADDVLEGDAAMLRKELEHFYDHGGDCFFLRYDYAHDPDDHVCTTVLWRERFVPRDRYRWVGPCHEVLIPNDGFKGHIARSETAWLRHVAEHRKPHEFSDVRNYAILKPLVEAVGDPDKVDPRWFYYLGNACRGLQLFGEAEHYYRLFLPRSGSRDDRVLALLHLGQMAIMVGRPWRAIRFYQEAELVHPDDPRADFGIQRAYFELGQWQEVLRYGERGLAKVPRFGTLNSVDPQQLSGFPHYFSAIAARELGDVELAVREAELFAATRPGLQAAQNLLAAARAWAVSRRYCTAVQQVVSQALSVPLRVRILQSIGMPVDAPEHGVAIPEHDVAGADRRADVSIFCGHTWERWGPGASEAGIGGSERMVELLARALARRGLVPTVYARLRGPADRTTDQFGVVWRHYLEFNPLLPRTFLVAWRNPAILSAPAPTERRYLWLHDIANPAMFDEVLRALVDRVIFISPWHARTGRGELSDDQVYVSRNGIPSARIRELAAAIKRERPYSVVYASSPDRGLHVLLRAWRLLDERGALPETADLSIYYGFGPTYREMARVNEYVSIDGVRRHRYDYMDETLGQIAEGPRIRLINRAGHDLVLRDLLTAGAVCYPATFDETFCLVAAEAQACGCAVIAPRRAALETTLHRTPLVRELRASTPEEVAAALRDYWRDPPPEDVRRAAAEAALAAFDIETLADEWVRDLFGNAGGAA